MSEVTELLEHAEHGGHGGGHGHGHDSSPEAAEKARTGKLIGLSMAMLGVMLAFCAAMVGSARTELIKTLIEQTQTANVFQASNVKFRMLLSQLQQLEAIAATDEQVAALHTQMEGLRKGASASAHPELFAAVDASGKTGELIADMITPTPEPLSQLIIVTRKYEQEKNIVGAWAESYDDAVNAHFEAAEGFERAQVLAEVGIVLASIALLLASRKVWYAAVSLGVCAAAFVTMTFVKQHGELAKAEREIEEAKEHFEANKKASGVDAMDEATLVHMAARLPADLQAKTKAATAVDEHKGAKSENGDGEKAERPAAGAHAAPAGSGEHH